MTAIASHLTGSVYGTIDRSLSCTDYSRPISPYVPPWCVSHGRQLRTYVRTSLWSLLRDWDGERRQRERGCIPPIRENSPDRPRKSLIGTTFSFSPCLFPCSFSRLLGPTPSETATALKVIANSGSFHAVPGTDRFQDVSPIRDNVSRGLTWTCIDRLWNELFCENASSILSL